MPVRSANGDVPWLRVLGVLLATVVALGLRQPDKLLFPQFWAEDAALFYPQAEALGVQSLGLPYTGYWHLYPRLVALVGTVTPVYFVPALYMVAALMAVVAALSVAATGGMGRRRGTQAALVAAALLTPFSREVWLILTNTQWLLGLLLVAVLASTRPATRAVRVCVAGGVLLAVGTGPFALLLSPLAVLRVWWHRDRWSLALLLLLAAGAALTSYALLHDPRGQQALGLGARLLALWHLVPARPLVMLAASAGGLVLLMALAVGVRLADWPIVACATAGLLVAAGTAIGVSATHLAGVPGFGGRYLFVPWSCTIWTLLLLWERGHRFAPVLLTAAAVLAAIEFPLAPLDRHDWARDAHCLETRAHCELVVNPAWPIGLPGRGRD